MDHNRGHLPAVGWLCAVFCLVAGFLVGCGGFPAGAHSNRRTGGGPGDDSFRLAAATGGDGISVAEFGRVYTAERHGMVVAAAWTSSCLGPGGRHTYQALHGFVGVDGREPRPVVFDADWGEMRSVAVAFPVGKGMAWRVDIHCLDARGQPSLKFVPFDGGAAAGGLEVATDSRRAFDTSYTAATAGVVLASAWTGGCRGAGTGYIHQNVTGRVEGAPVAWEATWDGYHAASVVFPVAAGQTWRADRICAESEGLVIFIPVPGAIAAAAGRTFAVTHRAETGGFVLASAWTGGCQGPSYPASYQALGGFVGASPALTIDHRSVFKSAWGDWRAVSLSYYVPRGHHWRVDGFCQDAATKATLLWIPVDGT